MDLLGVNHVKSPKESKRGRASKGVKVVYISSPMKVKTSASKFRALVQELTGRDSDAERYMETNNYNVGNGHHQNNVHELFHDQQLMMNQSVKAHEHDHVLPHHQIPFSNSIYDHQFPNCSDSLLEPFSGHFELDELRTTFDQI